MIEKQIHKLESFAIDIPTQKICVRLGYRTSVDRIKSSVLDLIEEAKSRAVGLLDPKAIYRILDYRETNKHPIFARAEKAALCICTIGPQLEAKSAASMKSDELIKGLILDAIGSEAVEQVAWQSDAALCKIARDSNLWPSKRFSPGYKAWNLEEQRFLFQMLPGEEIGVALNEACLMIPRKSVSFRINFYGTKELSTRSFR